MRNATSWANVSWSFETDRMAQGCRSWGFKSWPPKICRRGRVCFDP